MTKNLKIRCDTSTIHTKHSVVVLVLFAGVDDDGNTCICVCVRSGKREMKKLKI